MGLRLLLLRHAETAWNRERRYQGWTDTALSDAGRGQAEAAGRAPAAPPPPAGHARPPWRAAGAQAPARYRAWLETPHLASPAGGESLEEVKRRVLAGLDALRNEHDEETVCLVAHGITARILILEALGLPLARVWSLHVSSAGLSGRGLRP